MSVELAPIEVVGLKDALRELNSIDKKLRREVTKDFKQIMARTIADAQGMLPQTAPLSGMDRVWIKNNNELLPWNPALYRRQIKAFTSGKKVKDTGFGFKQNLAVFGMRWEGPDARLFDMSGKRGGQTARGRAMIRALNVRFGHASRLMWVAYERNKGDVEYQMRQLVQRVMNSVGKSFKV